MEFEHDGNPRDAYGLESAVRAVVDRYDETENALTAFLTAILARMPEKAVAEILTEADGRRTWSVYQGEPDAAWGASSVSQPEYRAEQEAKNREARDRLEQISRAG